MFDCQELVLCFKPEDVIAKEPCRYVQKDDAVHLTSALV